MNNTCLLLSDTRPFHLTYDNSRFYAVGYCTLSYYVNFHVKISNGQTGIDKTWLNRVEFVQMKTHHVVRWEQNLNTGTPAEIVAEGYAMSLGIGDTPDSARMAKMVLRSTYAFESIINVYADMEPLAPDEL